ncbi:MAG: hypothetical protein Q7R79_01425 [bacterium]|nr:hypothetical protein [bacterium]
MGPDHPGRKFIHPDLLARIDQAENLPWLFVQNLKVHDVIRVETFGPMYTFTMTDPAKQEALIKGDSTEEFFITDTPGVIQGTTLSGTGTMVKMGGIAPGYRLVVFGEGIGTQLLPVTKAIRLNGELVAGLPSADVKPPIVEHTWLYIQRLSRGDVIKLQTRNSLYTLAVEDPANAIVTVQGTGRCFSTRTHGARFIGCVERFSDAIFGEIVEKKIAVGWLPIISDVKEPFMLSTIRAISLNDELILGGD